MTELFLAIGVLAVVIGGMAVGVIFSNKPIKGSCGGMAALNFNTECDICGGDTQKCEDEQERLAKETSQSKAKGDNLSYDAVKK